MTPTDFQDQMSHQTLFPESTQAMDLQLREEFRNLQAKETHTSYKVILNDFQKAFVGFAGSALALPYLNNFAEKHGVCSEYFKRTLEARKRPISSMEKLWAIENGDLPRLRAFKLVFRDLCEVFLKTFCFDWIFALVKDEKMKYLNLRSKLLRRVWKLQALDNN